MKSWFSGRNKFLIIFFGVLFFAGLISLAFSPSKNSNSPNLKEENERTVKGTSSEQPVLSRSPSPSPSVPNQPVWETSEELSEVIRVIDGDTFQIETGQKVRLIGIDTPETSDPRKSVQCFGREAYEKTKNLLEGNLVKLEKDVSETDKYARLLRYVYLGDVFVNELLVKEGYARSSSYPPDIKYQELFRTAEQEARKNSRGLWSACAGNSQSSVSNLTPVQSSSNFVCDCSKSCSKLSSCEEAQFQLKNCGCSARDGDLDGIACDGSPLNCQQ